MVLKKLNNKGITLISLVITIMVLSMISVTIVFNLDNNTGVKKMTDLSKDLNMLKQKVSNFYKEYGKIPADIEYTNISHLKTSFNSSELEADSKFYVIDLQAMKGISLNYGRDYENVKNTNTDVANSYKDLYIINNKTHNIFYVERIEIEENRKKKKYYTD